MLACACVRSDFHLHNLYYLEGRVEFAIGNHKKGISILHDVLQDTTISPRVVARIDHMLHLFYIETGDYKKALEAYRI
ncbi:MAG: hypothetical protein GY810_21350 [Aureispira sp.]|nr:hypothetical protein [Aureispira sp.]